MLDEAKELRRRGASRSEEWATLPTPIAAIQRHFTATSLPLS